MAENPFKVGDHVECVEDAHQAAAGDQLLKGKRYTITKVVGDYVYVEKKTFNYHKSRFRLVSRPSEEWRNGDDVEFYHWKGKYVGVDPSHSDRHIIRPLNGDGTWGSLRVMASDEIRRPKPARTLDQLLERLGEGWALDSEKKTSSNEYFIDLCHYSNGPEDRESITRELCFWEPTRQACIDAAWELLVNEDGDEADSAE